MIFSHQALMQSERSIAVEDCIHENCNPSKRDVRKHVVLTNSRTRAILLASQVKGFDHEAAGQCDHGDRQILDWYFPGMTGVAIASSVLNGNLASSLQLSRHPRLP